MLGEPREDEGVDIPVRSRGPGVVDRELFDEAIRTEQSSVATSNRYLSLISVLAKAIEEAVGLMDSGRPADAREVLKKAHDHLTEKL